MNEIDRSMLKEIMILARQEAEHLNRMWARDDRSQDIERRIMLYETMFGWAEYKIMQLNGASEDV